MVHTLKITSDNLPKIASLRTDPALHEFILSCFAAAGEVTIGWKNPLVTPSQAVITVTYPLDCDRAAIRAIGVYHNADLQPA